MAWNDVFPLHVAQALATYNEFPVPLTGFVARLVEITGDTSLEPAEVFGVLLSELLTGGVK